MKKINNYILILLIIILKNNNLLANASCVDTIVDFSIDNNYSFICNGDITSTNSYYYTFGGSASFQNGEINGSFIINDPTALLLSNQYSLTINDNLIIANDINLQIDDLSLLVINNNMILGSNSGYTPQLFLDIKGDMHVNGNIQLNPNSLLSSNFFTQPNIKIKGGVVNNGGDFLIEEYTKVNSYYQSLGNIIFDVSKNNKPHLDSENSVEIKNGKILIRANSAIATIKDSASYSFITSHNGDIDINENLIVFYLLNENTDEIKEVKEIPDHLKVSYIKLPNMDNSLSFIIKLERIENNGGSNGNNNGGDSGNNNNSSINSIYNTKHTKEIQNLFNSWTYGSLPPPQHMEGAITTIDLLSDNNLDYQERQHQLLRQYDSLKPISNNTLMQNTKAINNTISDSFLNSLNNSIDYQGLFVSNLITNSTLDDLNITEGYYGTNSLYQIGASQKHNNFTYQLGLNTGSGFINNRDDYYNLDVDFYGLMAGVKYGAAFNINLLYAIFYNQVNYNGERIFIDGYFANNLSNKHVNLQNSIEVNFNKNIYFLNLIPYANFSYNRINSSKYMENGDDAILQVNGFKSDILTPKLGLKVGNNVGYSFASINFFFLYDFNIQKESYKDVQTDFNFYQNTTKLQVENEAYDKIFTNHGLTLNTEIYSFLVNIGYSTKFNHQYKENKIIIKLDKTFS
jgi:hypothetical protein